MIFLKELREVVIIYPCSNGAPFSSAFNTPGLTIVSIYSYATSPMVYIGGDPISAIISAARVSQSEIAGSFAVIARICRCSGGGLSNDQLIWASG